MGGHEAVTKSFLQFLQFLKLKKKRNNEQILAACLSSYLFCVVLTQDAMWGIM